MEALTTRQKQLIVANVLKACNDINKLNSTGYKYLYLCSGFIAHYNMNGFKAYYSKHSLKKDIEENYKQNQWRNFKPGDTNYEYYHSQSDVYNEILGKLLAQDISDAQRFIKEHFFIVHVN